MPKCFEGLKFGLTFGTLHCTSVLKVTEHVNNNENEWRPNIFQYGHFNWLLDNYEKWNKAWTEIRWRLSILRHCIYRFIVNGWLNWTWVELENPPNSKRINWPFSLDMWNSVSTQVSLGNTGMGQNPWKFWQ